MKTGSGARTPPVGERDERTPGAIVVCTYRAASEIGVTVLGVRVGRGVYRILAAVCLLSFPLQALQGWWRVLEETGVAPAARLREGGDVDVAGSGASGAGGECA